MSSSTAPAIVVVARLRRALEGAADCLVSSQLDGLLSAGGELEEALTPMRGVKVTREDERGLLRAEIEATRVALLRCRRLGTSLTELVAMVLHAQGHAAVYGPSAEAAAALSGRSFTARV